MSYLDQKVKIVAFLELLFECGKDERNLTFAQISERCLVDSDTVEMLVMKAMSLELVKGSIDEVDKTVHIEWIMPRYLNKEHMQILADRLGQWREKVDGTVRLVEDQSQELLNK